MRHGRVCQNSYQLTPWIYNSPDGSSIVAGNIRKKSCQGLSPSLGFLIFTSEEKRVITFAPLSFMQNKHKFIDLWPIKAQVSVLLYLSKFARWAEKRIGAQDLEIILWFTRFGWTFCSVVHFIRMYARQSKVKLVRINHCGLFAKRGLRFREKTTIYPAERIQSSL